MKKKSPQQKSLMSKSIKPSLIGILHDITGQKQSDETLTEMELRFKTILDSVSDGILLLQNSDKKFFTANKKICEMLGYTEKEILKLSVADIHPKESLPSVIEQFEKLEREEKVMVHDIPIMKKDKTISFADISGSVISVSGKKYITGLFRDITERKQAEDKLRESEEKYRELVKYAPAGIYEVDYQSGQLISVNDIICEYTGYTREELLNMNIFHLFTEESQNLMSERLKKLFHGEKIPDSMEYCIRTKSGEKIWVLLNARYIYKDGILKGSTGTVYNINERKKAEEALILIKEAVNSSGDAIGMSDPQGHHFYHNKAFTELFGYTPEELAAAGEGPAAFANKDVAREVFDAIMVGDSWNGEIEMVSKSGRIFPVLIRADAIKAENGKIIGLIGLISDITERKKAEEALRKEKDFSETLFNTAQTIILVLDTEARIERFNTYMEEISGYRLEEVKGKNWFDIFLPEEDHHKIKKLFKRAIGGISTKGNINPIINKDGRKVFVEWWDKTLKDENGRTVGLVSIGHDVTTRIKAEEILYESESKFRKIFESSHDGIFLLDMESRKFAICNQAFLNMLGYTEDELKNLNIQDIHPREELPFVVKQIKSLEEGKPMARRDTTFKKKDGSLCFADLSPSFLELGRGKYILAICRDITEQKIMEEELRKDKLSLEQKNIALTELMEHMERTKNQIKEDIAMNIEESIMPIIEKHKLKGLPPEYMDVLHRHLNELTSSFGRIMAQKSTQLSSREIEICNLIKGGLTTKEISGLLNISSQTVDKHRKNIRKKLGIWGKDKNLTTYLKSL